ncbi:tetratricopeptide repeat protein [mine drainage metagenome]|uniref:Tetratricopeptide repeat protein n=1 Tax=mine drainage metagenome TaxID=410659 RepID=A0A1J5TN49_9ZZZZ
MYLILVSSRNHIESTENLERSYMRIKLQTTLSLLAITLIFNNVYAAGLDVPACNRALAKGDFKAALVQANSALLTNKNDKDALICQGRAYSASGDLNSALLAFKSADALSENEFDRTITALLTGHAYKAAKQYDDAINSYQQTILHAKADASGTFQRIGQDAVGNVYFETKQFPLALTAYLAGSKFAANDNERADSYEKIAQTYHQLNQNDLALEFQIKVYVMYQAAGTLDQYAHSSIELGRYYAAVKKYDNAEITLNKIIQFSKEQGGAYFEAQGSYVLAQVKAATGDMASAKALVAHAKLIAKNTNDTALDEEIKQETQHMF